MKQGVPALAAACCEDIDLVEKAKVMFHTRYMACKYSLARERWFQAYRYVRDKNAHGLYHFAD